MITNYSANKILQALCGKASTLSLGQTAYVGLSTTAPTAVGGNVTEPSGNGYARVMLGYYNQNYTQKMGNPTNGAIENEEIIYYPEATGSWGTITHFCIFDAQTGGNLLAYGALTTSITPTANTIPIIRVGELNISLS
jgi:hypothetical protein